MAWWEQRYNALTNSKSATSSTGDNQWWLSRYEALKNQPIQPTVPSKPLSIPLAGNVGIGTNAPQFDKYQQSQQAIQQSVFNPISDKWNQFLTTTTVGKVVKGFMSEAGQSLPGTPESFGEAVAYSPPGALAIGAIKAPKAISTLVKTIAKEVKPKVIESLLKSVFPDLKEIENLFKPFAQKLAPITDAKVVQKELDTFLATKLPVGKEIKIKPLQPLAEEARNFINKYKGNPNQTYNLSAELLEKGYPYKKLFEQLNRMAGDDAKIEFLKRELTQATGGVPSKVAEEARGKYLYHGTNQTALENISKEGLKPGRTSGKISLSPNESYVQNWARGGITPQGKTEGVILRINQDMVKNQISPSISGVKSDQLNELISKKVIPPEAIEVYKNGKWQPLSSPLEGGVKGKIPLEYSQTNIEKTLETIQQKGKKPISQIPVKLQATAPLQTKKTITPSSENIIPPVKNLQAVKALEEDQFIKGLEENKLPEIKVSAEIAQRAEALSGMSEGSVNKLDDSTRKAFQEWVNTQKATKIEGLIKSKEFKDLDEKGINGIFEFQAGSITREGLGIENLRYADVKRYFDDKYKVLQDAGIQFGYKKDYLPQIWNNTIEEVQKVFGKALGLRPSFTLESVIADYKTGIDAGLKPKFQNISQLVGWYESKANKVLGDSKFFNSLRADDLIMPSGKAPFGWKTLDPDRFPKVKVAYENKVYQGTFSAPEELAGIINNYLKEPNAKIAKVANFVSSVKNRLLSFGIPTTAINFHGFNILARHTLFGTGGNPVSRFLTGAKYMVYPKAAVKELEKVLTTTPQAARNGLTVTTEDHLALSVEAQKFLTKFGKKWNEVFEVPLFEKMIPSLKLSSYNNLVKNGMAGEDAAKLVNNVYGGINWEQMGRNRDIQNLFRVFALTPDWLESTGRLGGNLAKSFAPGQWNSKVAARYRTMTATLFGSYVALNITNKMTSGHYSYENDPGHAFELEIGTTPDGQKRYWRPYGTAVDFVRLPVDVMVGALNGDYSVLARTIRNRLSPIGSFATGVLTDTDYRGQPVGWKGQDRYGKDMPTEQRLGGIAGEISQLLGFPAFAKQGIDVATGKQGIEQGLLQGIELPLRYSGGYFSKTGKIYSEIRQKKTAKERKALWNKMVDEGKITKNNVDEVTQYFKDEQLGTTDAERKMRNLGVQDGSRARAVAKEIKKFKTNKERVDYFNSLVEKKIITSQELADQITELLN